MVRVLAGLVLSVFAVAWTASAAPEVINPKAVEGVFLSLDSGVSPNAIRDLRTEQGYYRYLGAPMGASFQAPAGKGNGSFESIAREYVMSHYGAFGMKSNAVDFVAGKSVYQPKQVFIHLKQTYRGVRVFAGTAIVQVDYNGRVRSVNSDIMRDARMLDKNMVSTVPTLSVQAAQQSAVAAMTSEFTGSAFTSAGDGRLFVYDPEVLGDTGPVRLVWQVTVRSALPGLTHALLVDATTGAVVIKYPLEHSALNRQIYDAGNTNADPGQLARGEGGAESGVPDVNDAYDYYGDTYVFYADTHGRDSIDGIGMALSATTRYCPFTDFACPYENAFWSFDLLRMYFGEGFAEADDVVSHELTHGVTQFTSNLIYFRESGAINESFSDMWGEWVDLTNGSADDTAQNRWLLGEGLVTANFPVIRNMKNPPLFGHPDRLKSPLYFTLPDDNYGVHINSGIGNKLCYLLTDGSAGEPNGTFNGRAVAAMGIRAGDVLSEVGASEIMYYVQANLLSPASDYLDLGAAIQEAGIALELSTDLQRNIKRAGEAVEIIEASENALGTVQNFRAIHTDGSQLIQLSWDIAQVDLIDRVEVYRSTNGFALEPSQGLKIYEGTETLFVDGPLPDNAEVFYSIFLYQLVGESLIPVVTERQFARAVVGKDRPDEQTELFTAGSDLAFKQILFSPSVDTDVAFDSGVPEGYVNYTNYMRQTTDAEVLPVSRANSIKLPPTDDSLITIFLPRATPFFGSLISELLVSPRGFMLSKAAVTSSNAQYGASRVYDIEALSQPTLTSHFAVPRVSFFLSNVSPATSGERWIKILDDRFVVTYERVPTQGSNLPNTFQAELFYSGHVRLTFLELNAQRLVCGLSDGRGLPPGFTQSDLSTASDPQLLAFDPVGDKSTNVGETLSFDVTVHPPTNVATVIDTEIAPAGSTLTGTGNTRTFTWTPTSDDLGSTLVRFVATSGSESVTLDVPITVWSVSSEPVVTGITISPANPGRDDVLTLNITPQSLLDNSIILWYRNNSLLVPFAGDLLIPKNATEAGDIFFAAVTPIDDEGNVGETVLATPVVIGGNAHADVNKDGNVNALDVQLVINAALSKDLPGDADPDVTGDGKVDALDVQSVILGALS